MLLNSETINNLSRISSRGAFAKAVSELAENNKKIKVIAADMAASAKLQEYVQAFPNQFINVGIAEQNMIGIAAGLASEGYTVFVTTFAPFVTMRCFEQIRTQIGSMNLNVKIVGLMSGVAAGQTGITHYGLEDVALMRTIPNMTVISPADCTETVKVVQASSKINGPVYIRLTGVEGNPAVYKEDYDFKIGKGIILNEGSDIAIISTGTRVQEALRVVRGLKKYNLTVTVVDMHTIKPLDTDLIDKIFKKHKLVVTLEEHFKIGGLGSAVAEAKSIYRNAPPLLILGIDNEFKKAGDYNYMLTQCGLTAPQILGKIIEEFNKGGMIK